ncbi:ANTAR domain-containing protein [Nakamurella deserti]|uniref:ANTAR domain-containing protein n=1 Tax=Nakamurella deserti TaxID=2164074 RepID=UPI000DBE2497|nr:ANTAR domain-containing protein [Nakamurella deserti]
MRQPRAEATLAVGENAPVGTYRYRRATDTWWWSDEVYVLHGFRPGEVVPTSALLLAHKHPQDRAMVQHVIDVEIPATGSYCFRHKIVDAQRRVRTVIAVGQSDRDPETAEVIGLSGYFVDLTESERVHAAVAVANAFELSLEHRIVIEQAKGALMAVYGLAPDDAFTLLSTRSQLLNVKVRELAARMMRQLAAGGRVDAAPDPRTTVADVLALDRTA